jgi:putative ABC transport system ATP-binding protein
MIQVKDLHKSYHMGSNSLHVLKGINFNVKEGEMVSIMGSSGSGKSTFLNILGILDEADSGSYILDGVPIKNLNEKIAAKYRNEFLGFVFQSFNLIGFKSALDNVAMPLYYKGMKRKERLELAAHYLEKVGLADWSHHLPNEMSGGQKQRVAVARALVTNPKILLADEPTGALDSKTSYEVMELIQEINNEGKTVLIVTHENDIANMTKRIINLKDGVVINDDLINQHILKQHV